MHRMKPSASDLSFLLMVGLLQIAFSSELPTQGNPTGPVAGRDETLLPPAVLEEEKAREQELMQKPSEIEELRVEKVRMQKNQEDYENMQRMDSVLWLKTNAFKRPDETVEQLERDRIQRKAAALRAFCKEERFSKTADVDSIGPMRGDDRRFCKERLKLVNPLLQ